MTSRGPYRRHSTPFKLQLCQDIRAGVIGRRDAQRSHNISANLIQLWLAQFDRGELTSEEAEASVIAEYEARIIGGPGAFAIPALGREDFVSALRRKLILEIAGTPLGSAVVTSAP